MRLPFGVLRVRNFRLHFVGRLLSNVGTWFQSLAQALLVLELTGSGAALGLVTALQFAPTLLLGPYGGALADRVRPRLLLAVTATLAALMAATLAVVAATQQVTLPWLCGIALGLGCVQALDRPAAQAFLYELVGPEDLSRAIGLHAMTLSSARMLGPALAGAAYATLGSAACFGINALSFCCVLVALWRMRADAFWPRHRDASAVDTPLWPPWPRLPANAEVRTPLVVNVLIGCFAFSFMTTITAMIRFELGGDAGALGAAHALNAAGAVVGSLLVASLRRPPGHLGLAVVCVCMAAGIAVNAMAPSLAFFLTWAPCFGLTVGAYQTAMVSSVQRATDPAMLGRVSGLLAFGSPGMVPIASLIAGALVDAWSARAAMGLGAVASLVGALVLVLPLLRSGPRPAAGSGAT